MWKLCFNISFCFITEISNNPFLLYLIRYMVHGRLNIYKRGQSNFRVGRDDLLNYLRGEEALRKFFEMATYRLEKRRKFEKCLVYHQLIYR